MPKASAPSSVKRDKLDTVVNLLSAEAESLPAVAGNATVRHKLKTVQPVHLALLDSPDNLEKMESPDNQDKLAKLAPAKLRHPRANA